MTTLKVSKNKKNIKNKTVKKQNMASNVTKKIMQKYSIKQGPGEKVSKAEALQQLNSGVYGINWKDKAFTFNYPEEEVIANIMQGHLPFKHHVETQERKLGHNYKL